MLYKLKNRPLWYKLWAISAGICAFYYLIKIMISEPTTADRLIETYALVSVILDYFIFPKEVDKNNQV
jgi:hypothetical protein